MGKQYIVAKGRSILHKQEVILPGTVVSTDIPGFAHHLRDGYIVVRGTDETEIGGPPALGVDQDMPDGAKAESITLKAVGKWNLDPAICEKKTLEQLNVLVREKDASIAPFETKTEALSQLCQDFQKPLPKPAPEV